MATGCKSYIQNFTIRQGISLISTLLGILICLRSSRIFDLPLVFISLLSAVLLILTIRKPIKVCIPLFAFITIYALFLIIHPHPEFELRMSRFSAFLIGMATFSPLIENDRMSNARSHMWNAAVFTLTIMILLSFAIWIHCIISDKGMSDHTYYFYGFRGVFDKGMTLSPAAGIIAIIALHKAIYADSSKILSLWIALATISIVTCIAAGSRIAVLAMATASVIVLITTIDRLKSLLNHRFFRISAVCFIILISISMPKALMTINLKNQVAENHKTLIYSRKSIWSTRIDEIASSPFTGIGYANEFHRNDSKNIPGKLTYIEPGSGWLSLLSYGGIIGLSVFLWFLIVLICRIRRCDNKKPHIRSMPSLAIPLLCFFLIDSIAEGWLMFAGSLMFPLFWLVCHFPFRSHHPLPQCLKPHLN